MPTVYWFGVEGDYTVLILQIMGPNLEQLFEFCIRHAGYGSKWGEKIIALNR